MEYARRIPAGFYILISVLSLLLLGGCVRWIWDKGDRRDSSDRGDIGGKWHNEKNQGEHHEENQSERHLE